MKSTAPIVMIDDNEVDYLAAKRFINKSSVGNKLIYFRSGEDFIHYINEQLNDKTVINIALILVDVNMPGLNGYQTIEFIKNKIRINECPLVYILTSSCDPKDQEKAEEVGADGFLEKPFSAEGYIDLFNSLL